MIVIANRRYECIRHHVEKHPLQIGETCAPCTLIGMWLKRDQSGIKWKHFEVYSKGLRAEGLMKRSRV